MKEAKLLSVSLIVIRQACRVKFGSQLSRNARTFQRVHASRVLNESPGGRRNALGGHHQLAIAAFVIIFTSLRDLIETVSLVNWQLQLAFLKHFYQLGNNF